MNDLEKEIIQTLIDLKENHHVIAVKSEFEAEGANFDETLRLKDIADGINLDLTIKIGGCEALRDLNDVKIIGAKTIVAPMIESPYALKKYISSARMIFPEKEKQNLVFFINIETITGFNNLDEILGSPDAKYLDGVVFGRSDMCGSLEIALEEVNSERLLSYAQKIAQKTFDLNKELVIGGRISALSIPFLTKIHPDFLGKFETRKIVFDAQKALQDSNIETAIKKALDFELMWIKNKINYSLTASVEDFKRMQILQAQL